jgi:hypothetical protein
MLPVVLYGCESWSLTLREECRLRAFENRVLRRIFGCIKNEVTGEWRRLHSEELYSYIKTCLKRNIGIIENFSKRKNFRAPRVQTFKYMYKWTSASSGRNQVPCSFAEDSSCSIT